MKQKTSSKVKKGTKYIIIFSLILLLFLGYYFYTSKVVIDPAKCMYGPSFWCSSDNAWNICVSSKEGGNEIDRDKQCGKKTIFTDFNLKI